MKEFKIISIYFAILFALSLLLIVLFYQFSVSSNDKVYAQVVEDDDILGIAQVSATVLDDEDGDGMPNNWEANNGLNPSDPSDAPLDPDGDGLTNLEEYLNGTDPNDPDTDNGGTNDGDEVHDNCTDPLNPLDDGNFYCSICGDGILVPSEECDDGNNNFNDGCSPICLIEFCGDGIKNNVNEECDDDDGVGAHQSCTVACLLLDLSYCGDNIVEDPNDEGYSEECEGNMVQNASCVATGGYSGVYTRPCNASNCLWGGYGVCLTSEYCSDGTKNGFEECDDGNLSNGDGCSNSCRVEPVCGNGNKETGEECDDGNANDGDGCSSQCRKESICGNGLLEFGEECDDRNTNNNDSCTNECIYNTICGNSIKERGEQCDDGNLSNGDGCSNLCIKEGIYIDSDGDGMPDYWEDRFKLDKNKYDSDLDPDKDGLTNFEEYYNGTNPFDPDTDKDGLNDGDEVKKFKTNPLSKDSDNDLLNDYEEIFTYLTDPNKSDTDGGGIGDGYEINNKTNPLDPSDDLIHEENLYLNGDEDIKFTKVNNVYKLLTKSKYLLKIDTQVDLSEVYLIISDVKYKFIKKDEYYEIYLPINSRLGNYSMQIEFVMTNGGSIKTGFIVSYMSLGRIVDSSDELIIDSKIKLYYKDDKGKWKIYNDKSGQYKNPYISVDGYYGYVLPKGSYKLVVSMNGYETRYIENIVIDKSAGILNKTVQLNTMGLSGILFMLKNEFRNRPEMVIMTILLLLIIFIVIIIRLLLLLLRGEIDGVIYDYHSQLPIEGVNLKLLHNNKTCTTDKFGRFEFKNINMLKSDTIIIEDKGYKSISKDYIADDNKKHLYYIGDRIRSLRMKQDLTVFVLKVS